jgi:hypothetical protein
MTAGRLADSLHLELFDFWDNPMTGELDDPLASAAPGTPFSGAV